MNEAADRGASADIAAPTSPATESVARLTPRSTGRWLVTTRGSRHLFDLDAGTWRWLRGPGRGRFSNDDVAVALTQVEAWPEVGSTFLVWFDDPDTPGIRRRWHRSSTIASIRRVTGEPAP